MKICVFTYNFPHYKTQQGLLNLMVHGYKPNAIIAQEYKELNIKESRIKTTPPYKFINHPLELAIHFDIPYTVQDHNSIQHWVFKAGDYDLGIILGARILSQETIDSFKLGILNLHPGIIPVNRGLDNIKWAIHDGLPQGVTAHLIDHRIDLGKIIRLEIIEDLEDDSLVDISIKIQDIQQQLLIESLNLLRAGYLAFPSTTGGKYNKCMLDSEEEAMLSKFNSYKREYAKIVADFNHFANPVVTFWEYLNGNQKTSKRC